MNLNEYVAEVTRYINAWTGGAFEYPENFEPDVMSYADCLVPPAEAARRVLRIAGWAKRIPANPSAASATRTVPLKETTMERLCGMLVSSRVGEEARRTWPKRPPTGYDDRSWAAACANHVLLTARQFGEEPESDQNSKGPLS